MRTVAAIVVAISITSTVCAQDKALIDALQSLDVRVFKPDSADAKLRSDTLKKMRDDVNRRDVEVWRSIKTKADWEKLRDERLAKLRASLGTFPPTPKVVKVVTTKTLPGDGFSVECILYESRPGFYVTANLYVPAKADKPMPGFIVVHSHHNPKTQGELQDMGMNWARQGCLVLIPDMLGHGERRQHPFIDKSSYPEPFKIDRQDYYFRYNSGLQLHLVGESLIGWMVWDLMRGVDVLYQRPNIDKSKIVVFGSVAGGGDPCAVFAALDQRVTAAAPFNFGGPQPETPKLGEDAEFAFNYMGGASWESTRNLRLSGRDGFLPWLIVGSIAPRGLIYGHEFAWDAERDPVWARFQKIWGFYDVADKLASVNGRGSVKGKPPEATHCNNIGPMHRAQIYPTLHKWFGLPIIEKEYQKRFTASDLQCWTEEAKRTLKPKAMRELAREIIPTYAKVENGGEKWLPLLGLSPRTPTPSRGTMSEDGDRELSPGVRVKGLTWMFQDVESVELRAILIYPSEAKKSPMVIAVAQGSMAGFLKHRAETISHLLKNGVAVCLPELRSTDWGGQDSRGRASSATSYSAGEQMHGRTVMGTQVQELIMMIEWLRANRDVGPIALWGDSFAESNDPTMNFAVPYEAGKLPRQAEPMGATVALLGGLLTGKDVKSIYIRGGLVSYRSLLDGPFVYVPHDEVIPGILKLGDISAMAAALGRKLKSEAAVDGLNRRVDAKPLLTPAEVAARLTK